MAKLRVGVAQFDTGWHDAGAARRKAGELAMRAGDGGADIVLLPEMATTGFTMDTSQAEALTGETMQALAESAVRGSVYILAGLASRHSGGDGVVFTNSAVLISPGGEQLFEYRKQKLFGAAGEDKWYTAGTQALTFDINGFVFAPFICYDLRFPELFRRVAPAVHGIFLIANWPVQRRLHWDVLVRARAIENLSYIAAVNRTGEGGGAHYDGGSVVYGPWGELVVECGAARESVPVAELDSARVAEVRTRWPFLRDMEGEPAVASRG